MRRKKVGHIILSVGKFRVDVDGQTTQTGSFHVDTPILQGETVAEAIGRGLAAQQAARPRPRPDDHEGIDAHL